MTDAPLTPREEDEALAAEYVLGVLDLPERLAVEARLKTDAVFAEQVVRWETRLAGLNDGFTPVEPPPGLFPKIEARLFPAPARRRPKWFGWAIEGLVAAAMILGVLIFTLSGDKSVVVAELGDAQTGPAYEVRQEGERLEITRVAGPGPATGQAHELWVIAPGAAPVSLGLLGDEPLSIEYPAPPAGWVLAVSVEPEGGSPTGAPTGPVILTAEIGA